MVVLLLGCINDNTLDWWDDYFDGKSGWVGCVCPSAQPSIRVDKSGASNLCRVGYGRWHVLIVKVVDGVLHDEPAMVTTAMVTNDDSRRRTNRVRHRHKVRSTTPCHLSNDHTRSLSTPPGPWLAGGNMNSVRTNTPTHLRGQTLDFINEPTVLHQSSLITLQ